MKLFANRSIKMDCSKRAKLSMVVMTVATLLVCLLLRRTKETEIYSFQSNECNDCETSPLVHQNIEMSMHTLLFNSKDEDSKPEANSMVMKRYEALDHDRWIVITSIFSPSDCIKQMSKIPGWKVVVVGDRITPKDWSWPGVIFLGVKTQEQLGYRTTKRIPYGSYARKSIGYLFAIQHGAKIIYETDDDNCVESLDVFHYSGNYHGIMPKPGNLTFNPYPHFGQSTLWPRGFPLEYMGRSQSRDYTVHSSKTPIIQQGVVNGDPDVDAMFRITRKYATSKINITFDNWSPPLILPEGTFSPFNSQNTVFLYDALWAMVLPVTVTIRETDIYRSYWIQRLLWLLGHNLAFIPPRTFQDRNVHNYVKDLKQELLIYYNMAKMAEFLSKWSCTKSKFFDCILDLTEDLVKAELLHIDEFKLISSWLQDLKDMGYIEPKMNKSGSDKRTKHNIKAITFYPWEQPSCFMHTPELLFVQNDAKHKAVQNIVNELCDSRQVKPELAHNALFQNVLLVVSVSTDLESIPYLELLYGSNYPHILYCGMFQMDKNLENVWKVSYIQLETSNEFSCLDAAMKMSYTVDGYVFISDKVVIHNAMKEQNVLQMKSIFKNKQLHLLSVTEATIKGSSKPVNDNQQSLPSSIEKELDGIGITIPAKCTHPVMQNDTVNTPGTAMYKEHSFVYISSSIAHVYIELIDSLRLKYQDKSLGNVILTLLQCSYDQRNQKGSSITLKLESVDFSKKSAIKEIFEQSLCSSP